MGAGTPNRVIELPQRSARVSDDQATEIVRLDIRGKSQTEIAHQVGVHRATVSRVLRRTHAARQLVVNTEQERVHARAVYAETQRVAWQSVEIAMEHGRSPAGLLAEIRLCQTRIDQLQGLELRPASALDGFEEFKVLVFEAVRSQAPELGPAMAARLLAARGEFVEAQN